MQKPCEKSVEALTGRYARKTGRVLTCLRGKKYNVSKIEDAAKIIVLDNEFIIFDLIGQVRSVGKSWLKNFIHGYSLQDQYGKYVKSYRVPPSKQVK